MPTYLRSAYVAVAAFAWTNFLCYLKHKSIQSHPESGKIQHSYTDCKTLKNGRKFCIQAKLTMLGKQKQYIPSFVPRSKLNVNVDFYCHS